MKRVLTILLSLVLLCGFGYTLYYLWQKSEVELIVWETETPFVTTIIKKTVATGSVVPRQEVEIKPQVSGIIAELFVEPGAEVKRGDLLARVNIIPNMVVLANSESRVKRAEIDIAKAKWNLDRNAQLRVEGAIAESVHHDYEVAYDEAEEELQAARDNLELIRKGTTSSAGNNTNTLVRATIDGMVLEVPIEVGDSVIESNTFNDGTTIATIADMSELIFKGRVDESEVGKVQTGMELVLTIGAIEGRTYQAELEHIAPKGVEKDGAIQFEIRAALELEEGDFVRANLSANADVVLARRDDVLAIHESLLQFDDEKTPYVEVETSPQVFERRTIETGLSDGISIEIISGLSESEQVKNASKG